MSTEGYRTHQEIDPTEQGMDPEVVAAFAQAEEGMEPLPSIVEVENIDELARELGISPEALAQYRVANSGE